MSNTAMPKKTKFPKWLRKRIPQNSTVNTNHVLRDLDLTTVCEEAKCPNRSECYSRNTATFMMLGDTCTRNCHYCSISSGKPLPVDKDEPRRVAEAAVRLGLKHVVITSVNRDDLPDGGAFIFIQTIEELRKRIEGITVEVLTPDFKGNLEAVQAVCDVRPEVYNHNIETIERLFPEVRPGGDYERSLDVLRYIKTHATDSFLKSGFMVGLGEDDYEVEKLLTDLAECGVDIITIGQYLKPEVEAKDVQRFVHPDQFETYAEYASKLGIPHVYSSPFIRSSYLADEVLKDCVPV